LTSFTCCRKYPQRGESVNKGEIVGNYTLPECYYPVRPGNYVTIDDSSDLETSCTPGPLNINFNEHSVLGISISGKCDLKIIREVTIDSDAKVYTYKISFKDAGLCGSKITNLNMVLVPKIPSDYRVDFIIHRD